MRADKGLKPLKLCSTLNKAAQDYAREMATQNFYAHEGKDGSTPGERIQSAGYRWQSSNTSAGIAENIAAGQTGYVMCQGVLEGLNLGSFIAGDTLYVGATAGTLTATKPYAPNHLVYIGVVERANNGNGQIYVRPQNGYEMDELHNVSAQSPTNGDLLVYNSSTSLWTKSAQSTLVAGNVSGTVALANGGTGQTTANAAFNALAPSQTGNTGKILSTNGTDTSWVVMTDPTDIAISMAIALG